MRVMGNPPARPGRGGPWIGDPAHPAAFDFCCGALLRNTRPAADGDSLGYHVQGGRFLTRTRGSIAVCAVPRCARRFTIREIVDTHGHAQWQPYRTLTLFTLGKKKEFEILTKMKI